MATTTKKSEDAESTKGAEVDDPRGHDTVIEERKRRKEEATTVDGSETSSGALVGDPVEGARERGALGVPDEKSKS